jgi:hypothetical protein
MELKTHEINEMIRLETAKLEFAMKLNAQMKALELNLQDDAQKHDKEMSVIDGAIKKDIEASKPKPQPAFAK